jgi:hypothetical protein
VSAISTNEQHAELLRQINEVSALQTQLERAVHALVKRHGDPSEAVACAKELETSVAGVKRELVRQYLECRIVDATRAMDAANN